MKRFFEKRTIHTIRETCHEIHLRHLHHRYDLLCDRLQLSRLPDDLVIKTENAIRHRSALPAAIRFLSSGRAGNSRSQAHSLARRTANNIIASQSFLYQWDLLPIAMPAPCQADIVGWISRPARWLRQAQPPGAELSNTELVEHRACGH